MKKKTTRTVTAAIICAIALMTAPVFAEKQKEEASDPAIQQSLMSMTTLNFDNGTWKEHRSVQINDEISSKVFNFTNGMTLGAPSVTTWTTEEGRIWNGGTSVVPDKGDYIVLGEYATDGVIVTTASKVKETDEKIELIGETKYASDTTAISGMFQGVWQDMEVPGMEGRQRVGMYEQAFENEAIVCKVDYNVMNNHIDGTYFLTIKESGEEIIGKLKYTSDEPNIVRDMDYIVSDGFLDTAPENGQNRRVFEPGNGMVLDAREVEETGNTEGAEKDKDVIEEE